MFRLYTEDVHEARIMRILHKHFAGFTAFHARGSWHGKQEPSLVIELENAKRGEVMESAREIKAANNQESVMVTTVPDKARFI